MQLSVTFAPEVSESLYCIADSTHLSVHFVLRGRRLLFSSSRKAGKSAGQGGYNFYRSSLRRFPPLTIPGEVQWVPLIACALNAPGCSPHPGFIYLPFRGQGKRERLHAALRSRRSRKLTRASPLVWHRASGNKGTFKAWNPIYLYGTGALRPIRPSGTTSQGPRRAFEERFAFLTYICRRGQSRRRPRRTK